MKVLVWKSYGEISVLHLATGRVEEIKSSVKNIVTSWGLEADSIRELEQCNSIYDVCDFVNEYGEDTDVFERFEVVNVE